jgi:hypothetical protein
MNKVLLFIIVFLLSCKIKEQDQITIVGDWEYVKAENTPNDNRDLFDYGKGGYYIDEYDFKEKNICIYKLGIGHLIESDKRESRYVFQKSNEIFYKLNKNVLDIYFKKDSLYKTYRLTKLTNDSLVIQDTINKVISYYAKVKHNHNKINFDKIIVSSSGCYGACRVSSTIIENSGEIKFLNNWHTEQNGLFKAKISKDNYLNFQNQFNKLNIDSLKKKYYDLATDGNTITVTFIKNGKIYKTISDYNGKSPATIKLGCKNLLYLSQNVSKTEFFNPLFKTNVLGSFIGKPKNIILHESESAYLTSEIIKSKLTNQDFKPLYYMQFIEFPSNNRLIKILTDGRFYKFMLEDKTAVTYDLGYNFITKNQNSFTGIF